MLVIPSVGPPAPQSERERMILERFHKQITDPHFLREEIRSKDKSIFTTLFRKRPYPHNPLCGENPMKYPLTISAKAAQFPLIYNLRYGVWFRYLCLAIFPTGYIMYLTQKASRTQANIEHWKVAYPALYTKKKDPDDHLY